MHSIYVFLLLLLYSFSFPLCYSKIAFTVIFKDCNSVLHYYIFLTETNSASYTTAAIKAVLLVHIICAFIRSILIFTSI